jgi:hypothetical protein
MSLKVFRTNEEWHSIIASWQASGKNRKSWCEEHNIPPTSFYTAYQRLFPQEQEDQALIRSSFSELETSPTSGIEFSYRGAHFKLPSQFDDVALLRLLKVLEQLPC